jgi:hypothetical protein
LTSQARFANPRFAAKEKHPPAPGRRILNRQANLGQFAFASHETALIAMLILFGGLKEPN